MRFGIVIFLQCIILFIRLHSIEEGFILSTSEGETSVIIDKSINPISGDYIISETDLIIPGYEPIYFNRTYVSSAQKGREAQWSLFPHIYMHFTITKNNKKESTILSVSELSGSTIRYKNLAGAKGKDRNQFFPILGTDTRGLTNTGRGKIGAQTNLSLNKIFKDKSQDVYIMTTCDGTQRYYKKPAHISFAYLEKERKPNGNWVQYEYNEDYYTLKEIRTTNPEQTKTYAKISFQNKTPNPYDSKNFTAFVEKGENLHYFFHLDDIKNGNHFDHFFRLNNIIRPYLPEEKLYYAIVPDLKSSFLINKRYLDNYQIADISYYQLGTNYINQQIISVNKPHDNRLKKIKSIMKPVASDGSLVRTHHFVYNMGKPVRDQKKELKDYVEQLNSTHCFDAYNKKTEYVYNDFFVPLHIYKFGTDLNNPKEGSEKILFEEHFDWYFDGSLNRLQSKYYKDCEKLLSANYFEYDKKGNVIKETLAGNLSGHNDNPITHPHFKIKNLSDEYTIKTTYTNDAYALISSKTLPNGCSYKYEYLPNTNLITGTFTLYHGQIKIREFKIYNEDHVVIQTILDDGCTYDSENLEGVTQRTLKCIQPKQQSPALNFPEVIEEKYFDISTSTYHLLKKVVLHYSSECTITQEDIYDANNLHLYSIHNKYDHKQRLVASTDSLGRSSSFTYNNFHHLIEETLSNTALKIIHCKDVLGREFATTYLNSKDTAKESRIVYDLKSRIIQKSDSEGNITQFSYDDLGHEIKRILPARMTANCTVKKPVIKTINDAFGNPLSITDPLGNTTYFSYNATGKVTSITYPDNTKELFYYNLDGTLKEHHSVTGALTYFTYDYLERVTKKRVFSKTGSFLYEEIFNYDSFKLLSHIDPKGITTLYRYDAAGRKIEESKSKGNEFISREEYSYDNVGRLYKTIIHSDSSSSDQQIYIKLFDNGNRVIEEKQEDVSGNLFSKIRYTYDRYDNKISITTYINAIPRVEKFTYDDYKRITAYTDPEENTFYTDYVDHIYNSQTNSYEFEKIQIDPKGRHLKERYNSINQLLSITLHANNTIQAQESFYYDLNGNKIKQISKIFTNGSFLKEVTTLWEYDSRNRVVTLTEDHGDPLQKVSRFTYTADGKEKSITQPNGTILEYAYDDLRRLTSVKSSDNTIHYIFTYNDASDLIEEINALTKTTTLRTYNARGNLIQETLANGITLKKTYDGLGRKTSLTLHDQTNIEYAFDSFHLKKISKYTSNGALHYEHNYLSYNLDHQPTEESSIFNLCNILKTYDNSGRNTGIRSPYYSEYVELFDCCGNLLELHTESELNNTRITYSYDEFNHLIKEEGLFKHQYDFDSHHNRITKDTTSYTVNSVNSLLQESSVRTNISYKYTPNGNRSLKKINNNTLIYTYDALNRLISIETDTIAIAFTYDSWNRRLSKSTKKKTFFGYWESFSIEYYIYDDEKEIASTDSNLTIQQLRILGIGKENDIGATIAIETAGVVYAPFHDLFGNIKNLVDVTQKHVAESYLYSAFGECQIYNYYHFSIQESSINNPWRYQSKRTDDESDLVFFGRRFYDPRVGNWISLDPLGLTHSPNFHKFLLDNLLSNIDLYKIAFAPHSKDKDPPIPSSSTTSKCIKRTYPQWWQQHRLQSSRAL